MIDLEYLSFGLSVGIRNRVAIYNDMRTWLFESIAGRGFAVEDQALFNHLTIEQQAMRLADEVIADVEGQFDDIFSELGSPVEGDEAAQFVASRLMEMIDETKTKFLADGVLGLTWLIHDATGVAPLSRPGDIPMEPFMTRGPDRDKPE